MASTLRGDMAFDRFMSTNIYVLRTLNRLNLVGGDIDSLYIGDLACSWKRLYGCMYEECSVVENVTLLKTRIL